MYKDIFGKTRQKVGLHIHTSNSDGRATPEESAEIYKAHGYDAIAFTDHNKYNDRNEFEGITGIPIYNLSIYLYNYLLYVFKSDFLKIIHYTSPINISIY